MYGNRGNRYGDGAVLSADLRDAIDESGEALVSVDCSGVTCMGSSGYRVLVEATEYAVRRGDTLVIRDMSSSCALLLRLCDDTNELTFEPARAPRPAAIRSELCA